MFNKLNFCPYEYKGKSGGFQRIAVDAPEDLAYELIFMEGYKIEDLENTSLYIKQDLSFIHTGPDPRLQHHYNDKTHHYMLWESTSDPNAASGLRLLLDSIVQGNKSLTEGEKKTSRYEDVDSGEEEPKEDEGHEKSYYKLEWERQENGKYVFSYASGTKQDDLMEAVPCCPSCHQRLPIGWMDAEDFCGISLMAKRGGGKTTFLLSLMADDWAALKYLGGDWQITAAQDDDDAVYTELLDRAESMSLDGKCPPNTRPSNLIAPVFLNINYKGHKMIAGLYDNSGEVLYRMKPRDSRTKILTEMFAHIYLIEPKQMRVKLPEEKKKKADRKPELTYNILSLQDQGDLQRLNKGEVVLAESLLNKVDIEATKAKEDPLRMYFRYKELLAYDLDKLKRQYFCATIIKCDLLEGLKEMETIMGTQFLFNRSRYQDLLNEDTTKAREGIVEKIFDKYVFEDHRQKEILLRDFGGHITWHCISALGCNATEKEEKVFYLDGEYQPIRVAEPLLACLKKKIEENGWDG